MSDKEVTENEEKNSSTRRNVMKAGAVLAAFGTAGGVLFTQVRNVEAAETQLTAAGSTVETADGEVADVTLTVNTLLVDYVNITDTADISFSSTLRVRAEDQSGTELTNGFEELGSDTVDPADGDDPSGTDTFTGLEGSQISLFTDTGLGQGDFEVDEGTTETYTFEVEVSTDVDYTSGNVDITDGIESFTIEVVNEDPDAQTEGDFSGDGDAETEPGTL